MSEKIDVNKTTVEDTKKELPENISKTEPEMETQKAAVDSAFDDIFDTFDKEMEQFGVNVEEHLDQHKNIVEEPSPST